MRHKAFARKLSRSGRGLCHRILAEALPLASLRAEREETRAKFMPDIVAGRKACAIALTEPDHGSDLTGLTTTATDNGDHYLLNGTKIGAGNPLRGPLARFHQWSHDDQQAGEGQE